ncbi:MAG: acyl--CoA ligase [Candidatus Binatia bacterium]
MNETVRVRRDDSNPTSDDTLLHVLSADDARRSAIVVPDGGPCLTYAELAARVWSVAEALRRGGIGRGDRVAIVLPNGLEFVAVFLAVTWIGAVAAPLNPALTEPEQRFCIEDAAACAVIVAPAGAATARQAATALAVPLWEAHLGPNDRVLVAPLRPVDASPASADMPRPDDIALFLHTSGTTGRPKAVPLTHRNLMQSIRTIRATYRLTPADTSLIVMPLFHVHGLLGAALASLNAGGSIVVPPRFSARRFFAHCAAHRVTWYSAVPTIHRTVLQRAVEENVTATAFRFVRSCSAALPPELWKQLEARFAVAVVEAYGMTEAAHQMTANPLPPGTRKPGTVGMSTGVVVTIRDERGAILPAGARGEVAIAGPSVTRGYCNNPRANAAAFFGDWLRSGDEGILDADGFLTLAGRIKELINRGGEKISPLEIETALAAHPAVAEAACFGVPDPKYGEEVHAAVVLRADASERELLAFCLDRLARFKAPKKLHIVAEIPHTPTGKIQRQPLAARFRT